LFGESFLLVKILKFKNTYNFEIVLAFCGNIINSGGRLFDFPMLMEWLSKMIDNNNHLETCLDGNDQGCLVTEGVICGISFCYPSKSF
jgi:hypothetical protein